MPFPNPWQPKVQPKVDYVPLSLSAGAFSLVSYGDIPPRFSGSIVIVVTVSNADGSLRTDVSKEDFTVQMFRSSGFPAPTTFNLLEGPSATSHAYVLTVFPKSEGEGWLNGTHVIVVEVAKQLANDGLFKSVAAGRTVTSVEVSFQV